MKSNKVLKTALQYHQNPLEYNFVACSLYHTFLSPWVCKPFFSWYNVLFGILDIIFGNNVIFMAGYACISRTLCHIPFPILLLHKVTQQSFQAKVHWFIPLCHYIQMCFILWPITLRENVDDCYIFITVFKRT